MKRIISFILCLAILASAVSLTVFAQETPKIIVESVQCDPGEEVSVSVSVENNPGFTEMTITPDFEGAVADACTFDNLDDTYFVEGVSRKTDVTVDVNYFIESKIKNNGNFADDGVMLTLTFTVADNAADGVYKMGFIFRECYNADGNDVTFTVVPGYLTVGNPQSDASLEVGDYKGTRDQSEWLAPTEDGKAFAGWFTDETYTTVYTGTTGRAFAKFVDIKVMDVKAQKLINDDSKATLRFLSSIPGIDLAAAGFELTVGSKTVNRRIKNVYLAVNVDFGSTTPDELNGSADSKYITTFKLTGIPASAFGTDISVRSFWQTPDGTTVMGSNIKTVNVNMFGTN